jgi:hypothetical protein
MTTYYSNNARQIMAPELREAMTGSWVDFGPLVASPIKIIFDNQGTVDVAISKDGGDTTWKTFSGGEALILDLDWGSIPGGTVFSGNGASGNFGISYLYPSL